ncbi:MAG: EscU/YscU/HrcU family type III secretion system export apparatus switch protein [Oscillospiraceae bacterium]
MSKYRASASKKAVALKYDSGAAAPVIVASGLGYMAEKIVEVATENNLPVYEDSSLASILTQMELGTPVPEELYQAIVEIYVYVLNGCNLNEILK